MEPLKVIYQDNEVLIIDKPAGISTYSEVATPEKTLVDYLLEEHPSIKNVGTSPRYGIVHRLDKETSGLLLIAKGQEPLIFLQKQFKTRRVEKKYTALVVGNIKEEKGAIETLIGRSPKDRMKQKVFFIGEPSSQGKREAITNYEVIKRFEGYTLLEVTPKTGRQHQIRCHLAYINHPIAGDKLYGFKNQPTPPGLTHHFLHAGYLKLELPASKGIAKEFKAELPEDLKNIINELKSVD
jgi:23S rRNA pseudouridine1911/1915/1917 synthase